MRPSGPSGRPSTFCGIATKTPTAAAVDAFSLFPPLHEQLGRLDRSHAAVRLRIRQGADADRRDDARRGVDDRLRHLHRLGRHRRGRSRRRSGCSLAWVLTGVITLLGALAYGELAAMYPRAGGQYVFLREAMGPLMGFLYGWTLFVVIQTGTIAAVAVAFGRFLGVLWPAISPERFALVPAGRRLRRRARVQRPGAGHPARPHAAAARSALLSVWLLTVVNLRGVREGKLVQTTLTVVKTGALRAAHHPRAHHRPQRDGARGQLRRRQLHAAEWAGHGAFVDVFGSALVGSLFSSDAWNNVTFAAAEVQNPQAQPAARAGARHRARDAALRARPTSSYLNVLPYRAAPPTAATVLERGITHATQDRVGTAVGRGDLRAERGARSWRSRS